MGNTEAIKQLVEHNIGMTILCRSAVRNEACEGRLKPVPVAGLNLSRYFCLLLLDNSRRTTASRRFIEFILDENAQNSALNIK